MARTIIKQAVQAAGLPSSRVMLLQAAEALRVPHTGLAALEAHRRRPVLAAKQAAAVVLAATEVRRQLRDSAAAAAGQAALAVQLAAESARRG